MELPPEGEEGRLSQEARELLVELSLEELAELKSPPPLSGEWGDVQAWKRSSAVDSQ